MSEDKKPYRHITEEDFKKYLRGELKGKAAHDVERQALDLDFEGDALEGWGDHSVDNLEQDMSLLRERLARKRSNRKLIWWQVAAVVLLLMVSGVVLWNLDGRLEDESGIAQNLEEDLYLKKETPSAVELEEKIATENEQSEDVSQSENPDPMVPQKPKSRVLKAAKEEIIEEDILIDEESFSDDLAEVVIEDIEIPEEVITEELVVSDLVLESEKGDDAEGTVSSVLAESVNNDGENLKGVRMNTLVPAESTVNLLKQEQVLSDSLNLEFDTDLLSGKVADVAVKQAYTKASARSTGTTRQSISGVVKSNEDNQPIPGVNVMVLGTARGTVTDLEGKFELELQPGDSVLSFAFIGLESQEQTVANNMEVLMEPDVMSLSEVVVTGYGVSNGSNSTGSVTRVDMNDQQSTYSRAQPKGGMQVFKDYVKENLRFPQDAKANNITGTVKLKLQIAASGSITNIEVVKSLGYGCDEEAIRLIKEGPKWQPAQSNDEVRESSIIIKIRFR